MQIMKRAGGYVLASVLTMMVFVCLSGLAAGQPPLGPGGCKGYGAAFYTEQLPAEKQAAAKKIFAEFYEQTATLRQESLGKRHELFAEMAKATPDVTQVEKLGNELGALRTKLFVAKADLQNKLNKEGLPPMPECKRDGKGKHGKGKKGFKPDMAGPSANK